MGKANAVARPRKGLMEIWRRRKLIAEAVKAKIAGTQVQSGYERSQCVAITKAV